MDPDNKSASAPPTGDEKSGAGYTAPPPYQDFPLYPNQQPGQYVPPQPQGYGPPPQQPYAPYGQGYPAGPGQYPQAGPGQYPQAGPGQYPQAGPGQYPQAGPGQYPAQPQGFQGATVTMQPTVFVTRAPLPNPVNDYLGYSIFTMLCCCLPLGIAALIYSISTRDANMAGNLEEATKKSDLARKFNHAALGIGLILGVCYVVLISMR